MPKLSLAALPHRAVVLAVAAILVVAGAVAFASLRARHATSGDATGQDDAKASASDAGDNSGVAILLGLARQATHDGRLVSPQGNNAYEYYLSVIQLEPGNATAQDALRETIPFAAQEIEQLINRRQLEEARREIALLRDYDPTNYTLIILGAKLDAQQQVVTAEDEAKADAMRRRNG
jgi:protein TonB